MNNYKACHIMYEHHPFDARIFVKEAQSLRKHGLDVVILAPSTDRKTIGRKKEISLENDKTLEKNGVIFEYYSYNKKIPKLFGLRKYFTKKSIIKQLSLINADIYHFHEHDIVLEVCNIFKDKFPEKKVVFDFHEFFYAKYIEKPGKWSDFMKHIKEEKKLLERADLIITLSQFLSDYYQRLGAKKVCTILNSPSKIHLSNGKSSIGLNCNEFYVCHEGRLLFDRGLKDIIEIARLIKKINIKFLVIGDMPKREKEYFEKKTTEYGITDKFILTGWLKYEDIGNYLSNSKIGICFTLAKNSFFGFSNKFFNYLAYGLVILSSRNPSTDSIISEEKCGFIFDNSDYNLIAAKIEELYDRKELLREVSENSRKAYENKYNWDIEAEKLINAYNEILRT